MIRPAIPEDKDACAQLLYLSGPQMFSYFLVARPPKIYRLLEVFYTKPAVLFSYEKAVVKEENSIICGMVLGYPVLEMKTLSENMIKYGSEIIRINGLLATLKTLVRSGLEKYIQIASDDEYYISNLAVFEAYRGRGYATELLHVAEKEAKRHGLAKLSLFVEYYNKHAKNVYEKFGFVEEQSVTFPEKYKRHNLDGIYKMVKTFY